METNICVLVVDSTHGRLLIKDNTIPMGPIKVSDFPEKIGINLLKEIGIETTDLVYLTTTMDLVNYKLCKTFHYLHLYSDDTLPSGWQWACIGKLIVDKKLPDPVHGLLSDPLILSQYIPYYKKAIVLIDAPDKNILEEYGFYTITEKDFQKPQYYYGIVMDRIPTDLEVLVTFRADNILAENEYMLDTIDQISRLLEIKRGDFNKPLTNYNHYIYAESESSLRYMCEALTFYKLNNYQIVKVDDTIMGSQSLHREYRPLYESLWEKHYAKGWTDDMEKVREVGRRIFVEEKKCIYKGCWAGEQKLYTMNADSEETSFELCHMIDVAKDFPKMDLGVLKYKLGYTAFNIGKLYTVEKENVWSYRTMEYIKGSSQEVKEKIVEQSSEIKKVCNQIFNECEIGFLVKTSRLI